MLLKFYRSTIGKKVIMAVTGLIFVGFVITHMAGNLKIFAGINPASGMYKFDEYAHALREFAAQFLGHSTFLWVARVVLLGSVLLHILMAFQLAAINKKAKPRGMHKQDYGSSSAASRTMMYGGLFLIVFIVYHILHLTIGSVHYNGFVEGQVYANVYYAFQNPVITGFYCLAMLFLALHLYHGTWSLFQTLGVDNPAWNGGFRTAAKLVSIIVFIGFVSVPLSVTFGCLKAPNAVVVQK